MRANMTCPPARKTNLASIAYRLPPRSGRPPRSILCAGVGRNPEAAGTQRPTGRFAEPSDQGRRTQPAHSNVQRGAERLPLCSAEPLGSFFSGAIPRAGVLNAESRRNAEVPCPASRHAAGRADLVSERALSSRPENQPPSKPSGCLRVPGDLRVPSSTHVRRSADGPVRRPSRQGSMDLTRGREAIRQEGGRTQHIHPGPDRSTPSRQVS